MVQKADRKPASVEPASRRRSTAFCSRRLESYLCKLCDLHHSRKVALTQPLFSHPSSHVVLSAPSSTHVSFRAHTSMMRNTSDETTNELLLLYGPGYAAL